MQTDYILDTVGKFCPVPIIETASKIKEMNPGETVTILSDDEGILSDMPSWCEMTGNEFLGGSQEQDVYHLYVRKAGV